MNETETVTAPPVENGEVKPKMVKRNYTLLPATPAAHFATAGDWVSHYFVPAITKKEVTK